MPRHKLHDHTVMHLSMLSRWEGRPGIGGGFDSSHRPVVGTFDRFNGLSSTFLLTFSCYFDNPQIPWGGAFEQKLSAQFKCPAYARPPLSPPPPQQLNIDRCINVRNTWGWVLGPIFAGYVLRASENPYPVIIRGPQI